MKPTQTHTPGPLGTVAFPSWLQESNNLWTTSMNGVVGGVLRDPGSLRPTTYTAFACVADSSSEVFTGRGAFQAAKKAVIAKLRNA